MFPILEFDPHPTAILNPTAAPLDRPVPSRAVACFFQDVLKKLAEDGKLTEIGRLASEIGTNPLFLYETSSEPVLVFHPGVGAPLAAGAAWLLGLT